MAHEGEIEIHVSTRKEREARQKSKRFSGWRRTAQTQEEGWDRRLLRIWGGALILGFLLPVRHAGGGFRFVWDHFDRADPAAVLWSMAPVVLGVVAIVAAALSRSKVRGLIVWIGSLIVIVGPIVTVGPRLYARRTDGLRDLVAIWLIVLIAPATVAAANHALRRTREDRLCRALVGLGGLAMLLGLFLPIGLENRPFAFSLFAERGPFGNLSAFPLIGWLLIVLMFACVATVYLYARLDKRGLGGWLSMAARFALWGFPIALFLVLFFSYGIDDEFLEGIPILLGLTARLYGLMILVAVGLALLLERTPASSS